MDYITVAEAAVKWGVSQRQVHRLLAAKRIPRVVQFGKSWMIPVDAVKPGDPRFDKKDYPLSQELTYINTELSHHMPVDNPDAILEMTKDKSLRVIPEISLAYMRGDFEYVKHRFQEISENGTIKLVTSGYAIAAAISLGDYPFFLETESWLKNIKKADISDDVTAYAELQLAVAYIGMSIPEMAPDWMKDGDFSALGNPVKPHAAYIRIQYISRRSSPELTLAAAKAYLSLCESENSIYIPEIYLQIYCAEAYYALDRKEEAKACLRGAMKKNLPHGFISPFAEELGPLHGLCERLLKQEFPTNYDAVVSQCERSTRNWVLFHNRIAKDNIEYMLPRRDYQMARLVVHGVPLKKIAEEFNLSVGTVRNRMQVVYERLHLTGNDRKKKLSKYIL